MPTRCARVGFLYVAVGEFNTVRRLPRAHTCGEQYLSAEESFVDDQFVWEGGGGGGRGGGRGGREFLPKMAQKFFLILREPATSPERFNR